MNTFEANCRFSIVEDDDGRNVLLITDSENDQVALTRCESELLVDWLLEAFDEDDAAKDDDELLASLGIDIDELVDPDFAGPCGICDDCIEDRLELERQLEACDVEDCVECLSIVAILRNA